MDCEVRPTHQPPDHESSVLDLPMIDSSTPLPSRCRTFRLSETLVDMNESMLCDYLDSLARIHERKYEGFLFGSVQILAGRDGLVPSRTR
jgi:hypothetical protein